MSNIIEQYEKDKITFNANILQLQQEKADYIQIHTALSVGKEKDSKNLQNELQTVRNDLKKLHFESEDSKIHLETSRRNSSNIVSSLQAEFDMVKTDLVQSRIEKDSTAVRLKTEENKCLQLTQQIVVLKEKMEKNTMEGGVRLNEKEELVATLTQKEKDSNYKLSNLEKEILTLTARQKEGDTRLESVNRDTSAERAALKSEIVTLKTDIALMKEEVLKANEAKVESDKQIVALSTGLQQQNDSHAIETEGYTAAITKLKGKYRESLGDLQSQSSKAEASAEKEEKLVARLVELEESSSRMLSEVVLHNKEIDHLESEIKSKDSEIVTLRSNDILIVSALQTATHESKVSSERLQKRILDLEIQNLQLVTKVDDLAAAYDAKCSSFNEIFEISEENKSERSQLINELELVGKKKENEIMKNIADMKILKKEISDMTVLNKGLKIEIDLSNEKVKHFSFELDEVRTVHSKSLERLQFQLSALQTEKLKVDTMTQNKILEKELFEMKVTLDSLAYEKENLQNNFTENINEVIDQNLKSQRQNLIISEYNESK